MALETLRSEWRGKVLLPLQQPPTLPWADGAAAIIEVLTEDEHGAEVWVPIVSELIPEHIADKFKQH